MYTIEKTKAKAHKFFLSEILNIFGSFKFWL